MRELICKYCIAVAAFFAGKLYESVFGDFSNYTKGWDDGFDEAMAFAKDNKGMIDGYRGHGVWYRESEVRK